MEEEFLSENTDVNTDVYGTAKSQMRISERILAELPGFRGYKEKELRRESDKLIRNHLYQKLVTAESGFKTIFQKMADRRQMDVLTDMDRVVAKFDTVSAKVNHASYGYTGFFDAVKIQEAALDRMLAYDNQMMDQVNGIVNEVDAFKSDVSKQKFDKASDRVQNLTETLDAFAETLDKREGVIMGVS
jgi:ABC-type transporter Mla subunit MlaD